MPEQLSTTGMLPPQPPVSQEKPWETRLRRQNELITTLNGLEGDELEQGLANHYQTVIDETIAAGGDAADVDAALHFEDFAIGNSGANLRLTLSEDSSYEQTPRAKFLTRVDSYQIRKKVADENKGRVAEREAQLEAESSRIKRELFSYQDTLQDEGQRQQAIEFTMASASADKYARTLAKELFKGNGQDIESAKERIRSLFDETVDQLPDEVKGSMSPFAASDSWIYWDIAKQKYQAEHPPVTEEEHSERKRYFEFNPLEIGSHEPVFGSAGFSAYARIAQSTIAHRHIGWEVHQMAQNGVNMEWLKQYPIAAPYLLAPTKEDGQLHSWQYAALGKIVAGVANHLDYFRNVA